MNADAGKAIRFTGWTAIAGGLFAYLNIVLVTVVTGTDVAMTLHGPTMLTLPTETRDLFRWGMFADIFGFYLPVLVIGGYLWHAFREETRAFGDMAALAILSYVVVGVAGAVTQLAVLHPLAQLHAGGDEGVKAAAEAAWTAVANAAQKGLWWSEGPVVLFWGLVVGNQLKQAGWGRATLLAIVGWSFALSFLFGFFPGLSPLMYAFGLIVVLGFPTWMLLFGWQLLRQSTRSQA